MYPILELYRDRKNEFRARIKAPNGKILFTISEGYKRRRGLLNAVKYIVSAEVKFLPSFNKKK